MDAPDSPEDGQPEGNAESEAETGPDDHLRMLKMLLRRVDSKHRRRAAFEGLVWYLATMTAVAFTGAVAGTFLAPEAPIVPRWILIVGGSAATLGGLLIGIPHLLDGATPWRAARMLQRQASEFHNDLVAALEFGERLVDQPEASDRELGFGRQLGEAHVERALTQLREATDDGDDFTGLLPERNLEAPLLATCGGLVLLGGLWATSPTQTLQSLSSPIVDFSTREEQPRVRPIVGDLQLRYAPPSYSGERPREMRRNTGRIEVLAGTEVTISAFPLVDASKFEMVLKTGGKRRVLKLTPDGSGRIGTSVVLTESGHYRFRAETTDGTTLTDDNERPIEITPDEPPELQIESHSGTVRVSPNDTLEIAFKARDDFGLRSISSVHHFQGSDEDKTRKPVEVPALTDEPESVDETFEFDLAPLDLKPKDRISFYLRAEDNNTRTGPGVGKSEVLTLRVQSKRDKHLRALRRQKQLADQWLQVLGDYLANPIGERASESRDGQFNQTVSSQTPPEEVSQRIQRLDETLQREGELLEKSQKFLERLEEEPLSSPRNETLTSSLVEQFESSHERGTELLDGLREDERLPDRLERSQAQPVAEFSADAERTYEKGVLQLLELVASQKMEAVKATREDIDELKNRLKERLEKYKETKDPELKKEIKREIKRLRQRMQEMMSRMQTQIRDLPKRHLNKEALKQRQLESETKNISKNLESMEKKLEEGDVDGAIEQLDELDSALGSLGEEMDQQFSDAQPKGLSKFDKQMSKLMDEVNNLKSAEKKLEESTRKLQEKLEKDRQRQIEEMLESFTQEMKQKTEQQLEDLEAVADRDLEDRHRSELESTRKSLEKLKKQLDQQDIQQAAESAKESLDQMRTMRFNLQLGQRHADPKSKRKAGADRALEKLDEMMPRGRKMKESLENKMKRAERKLERPGGDRMRRLSQRQGRIEEQAEKLQKKLDEASQNTPGIGKKLKPQLDSAKDQMKDARERLAKGEGQGALDSERSALEQLDKLKKSMKQTMKRRKSKSGGGSPRRKEDVDIPGQQEDDEGAAIRREVMRGMKENKIEEYEKEIDRYYKRLVE